jgi:hypothetical protein
MADDESGGPAALAGATRRMRSAGRDGLALVDPGDRLAQEDAQLFALLGRERGEELRLEPRLRLLRPPRGPERSAVAGAVEAA